MELSQFLKVIETEIKMNGSQANTAKKINKGKGAFNMNLKTLREGKGMNYDTLKDIMNGLGYDIYIKKRMQKFGKYCIIIKTL
jgi:ABC-type microcin C transport system permease subunit YejB